jgi:hypothetical protein
MGVDTEFLRCGIERAAIITTRSRRRNLRRLFDAKPQHAGRPAGAVEMVYNPASLLYLANFMGLLRAPRPDPKPVHS